jgi:hypothetical protein
MTSIYFFPWLDAQNSIDFGSVLLEPYERGELPGNQERITQDEIDAVLNFYKTSPTENVQRCLLIRLPSRQIGEDLNEDEKSYLRVFGELLCFSHIAERTYFGWDYHYCCKEDFAVHGHGWSSERFDGHIVIHTRRRDGVSYNMTDAEYGAYHRPHNANKSSSLQENPPLLQPLLQAFQNMNNDQWGDIYECVINYNLANTDNALIAPEAEIVLLHSAFDAIFRDVGDNPKERTKVFQAYMGRALKTIADLQDDSCLADLIIKHDNGKNRSLIEHWIKDFKLTRGHHAHGGTSRNYPGLWSQPNHLVLGSFVLPLLVKKRLESAGFYTWSHEDYANLSAFEGLIQYNHFSEKWCDDVRKRSEHPWYRASQAVRQEVSKREMEAIVSQALAGR